jgi:hypothetical protein
MQGEDDELDALATTYKFGLSQFRVAQYYFLHSIERHVSEALDALKVSVFPVWQAAQQGGGATIP